MRLGPTNFSLSIRANGSGLSPEIDKLSFVDSSV